MTPEYQELLDEQREYIRTHDVSEIRAKLRMLLNMRDAFGRWYGGGYGHPVTLGALVDALLLERMICKPYLPAPHPDIIDLEDD